VAKSLSFWGILARTAAAIVLVVATYNPSGHSYLGWALRDVRDFTPLQAVLGILLLAGWILYVRAALHALGWIGVGLAAAFIAALVWLLVQQGLLNPQNAGALAWIALIGVGLILGVGLSWSAVRQRLTGQVDVEGPPT
jgi:hypothetical protein